MAHVLRSSLNGAAYRLALETGQHPARINAELNRVMGVRCRNDATEEQLGIGLEYVRDQLNHSSIGDGQHESHVVAVSAPSRQKEILAELLAIAAQQATLAAETTVLLCELDE